MFWFLDSERSVFLGGVGAKPPPRPKFQLGDCHLKTGAQNSRLHNQNLAVSSHSYRQQS